MQEGNHQKIKLLLLMEILRRETDEDHPITTSEICRRLNERGITCERRTVGKDIRLLRERGYEIMSEMAGHENSYWIADRSFSLPELKILMDAVQAAHFIPAEKTEELVSRIAALGGSHQAELLQGNLVRFTARKHRNQAIYYNVLAIETAIQNARQVSFRYFDLDENRDRIYRADGGRYCTDPLALVYDDNNYYMVAYSEKYDHITPYRVDRMDAVRAETQPVSKAAPEKRDAGASAVEQAFRMYMGRKHRVTLAFTDRMIGAMYDKFGEGLKIERVGENRCRARVEMQSSPTFFSWLFLYPGEIRIVEPKALAEQYLDRLRNAMDAAEAADSDFSGKEGGT